MENPKFKFQPRILHADCKDIRHKGSSGGVITQIIKYLFESQQISCAVAFKFSGVNLFEPYIAKYFSGYNQTGSIYHEINLYKYLKQNIDIISSPILVTCLPCEILPIRRLLEKHHIEVYVIALVCSSQLSKEATYYFLEKNHIDISEVTNFRYRGNGWPSGIQIETNNKEYFFHNNNSKWLDVFHSQIFTLDKCFSCSDTFGLKADISVADPWLDRYVENDKVGSSIVIANTFRGESILTKIIDDMNLISDEEISRDEVILSQKGTIIKKYFFKQHRKSIRILRKIFITDLYKTFFYKFSKIHIWVIFKVIRILKQRKGIE